MFLVSVKIALGISVEDPSLFGIIPEMSPRFSRDEQSPRDLRAARKIRGLRDFIAISGWQVELQDFNIGRSEQVGNFRQLDTRGMP